MPVDAFLEMAVEFGPRSLDRILKEVAGNYIAPVTSRGATNREIGAKKGELRRQRRTAPPVVRREIDLQLQLLDNIDSEVRLLGHATRTCILSLGPLDPGPR